MATVPIAPI